MQDPLKQGLKPISSLEIAPPRYIRMQDPLKQGLKPYLWRRSNQGIINSNARSTKTRIETYLPCYSLLALQVIRMQDPLKQGLKLHLTISISYQSA